MILTVNKADVRRFIAWIESADYNPCCSWKFDLDLGHYQPGIGWESVQFVQTGWESKRMFQLGK